MCPLLRFDHQCGGDQNSIEVQCNSLSVCLATLIDPHQFEGAMCKMLYTGEQNGEYQSNVMTLFAFDNLGKVDKAKKNLFTIKKKKKKGHCFVFLFLQQPRLDKLLKEKHRVCFLLH